MYVWIKVDDCVIGYLVAIAFVDDVRYFGTDPEVLEYKEAPFTIADSVYGSTFFLTTGFHGFHVLIGTIFLLVCLVRLYNQEFTREHHVGFESAIWYWHFVDVVWLFLFVVVYWWGGSASELIDPVVIAI